MTTASPAAPQADPCWRWRHQDLEGVLATVVRYYGGIQLGAGGLVRAYTDAVAKALITAEKNLVIRQTTLRCVIPYALEGWLRRELDAHDAHLLLAQHGDGVEMTMRLPEASAGALRSRLNDAGQGRVLWCDEEAAQASGRVQT